MGTDTTTSTTPETPQPLDTRRLLALIALADDLPVPEVANLNRFDHSGQPRRKPILGITLHTLNEARQWATWLGATSTSTKLGRDGKQIEFDHTDIAWHGWIVYIFAYEDPASTGARLDAETRGQLEQVAAVTVDDTAGGV